VIAIRSECRSASSESPAKAGDGKILKVESLTKNEKLVAYEAKVKTAGKILEIQVGPDGKPLDHEE